MRDTWPRWVAAIPGTALIGAGIYALVNHVDPWACAFMAALGTSLVAAGTGNMLHIVGKGFTVGTASGKKELLPESPSPEDNPPSAAKRAAGSTRAPASRPSTRT